jgi:DNA mismatch repair ATPase MutL
MKCLAKIRRLVQAYALARPAVRFSLRVLKAKSTKGDFVYAPKKDANVEDAVLKIFGKDCALQCDWTVMESDGFQFHAFLPKPSATRPKIANEGAFISIDARPMTANRGTSKQIVATFKERLHKANPTLKTVKDPFFCMNISCPPGSYDPNIEPAKDDVLFKDGKAVVAAAEQLFISCYPESVIEVVELDDLAEEEVPISAQQPPTPSYEELPKRSETLVCIHEHSASDDFASVPSSSTNQPPWRSDMYSVDEEDLYLFSESQPPIVEEEEGREAASISNPWTIARMSASVNAKKIVNNEQLVSPAKSYGGFSMEPSSPTSATIQHQQLVLEPVTPQTSLRRNMTQTLLDDELDKSIQRLPESPRQPTTQYHDPVPINMGSMRHLQLSTTPPSEAGRLPSSQAAMPSASSSSSPLHASFDLYGCQTGAPSLPFDVISSSPTVPRHSQRRQVPQGSRQKSPKDGRSNDTWFGQPICGSVVPKRTRQPKSKQTQQSNAPLSSSYPSSGPKQRLHEPQQMNSRNNTDIRDFFGRGMGQNQRNVSEEPIVRPSFTPINARHRKTHGNPTRVVGNESDGVPYTSLAAGSFSRVARASSSEPLLQFKRVRVETSIKPDNGKTVGPSSIIDQLRAYAARETLSKSGSRATSAEPYLRSSILGTPPRSQPYNGTPNTSRVQSHTSSSPQGRNIAAQSHSWGQHEDPSRNTSEPQPRYPDKRSIVPTHETLPKSPSARCRTTDGAQRPKLLMLPLERVPHRYQIHNVMVQVAICLRDVINSMGKTDMTLNSLEWGCVADQDVCNTFSTPITNRTLDSWALKAAQLLNHLHEQENDVDVFREIRNGIRKALQGKRQDTDNGVIAVMDVPPKNDVVDIDAELELEDLNQIEEWTSQVLVDERNNNDDGDVLLPQTAAITANGADEFEQGIDDDEMLLNF